MNSSREALKSRFASINFGRSDGRRAPHKALLCLWAIGRCLSGAERLAPFLEVDEALRQLLTAFGSPGGKVQSEPPFWRLQQDGLWEVPQARLVTVTTSKDPHRGSLIENKATGGFPADVFDALARDPELAMTIAWSLVEDHYPASLQSDVLMAAGLASPDDADRTPQFRWTRSLVRNPEFRTNVLSVYGHRCAVCTFAVHVGNQAVALEAAHIRWHCECGPDTSTNGLALCSLHHALFDRGAFTLTSGRTIEVSRRVSGSMVNESLRRHDGQPLAEPSDSTARAGLDFIDWHRREVFRATQ